MKQSLKWGWLLVFAIAWGVSACQQPPATLDELLGRYHDAINHKALRQVESLHYQGSFYFGNKLLGPFELYQRQPNHTMGTYLWHDSLTVVFQAFDGESAWRMPVTYTVEDGDTVGVDREVVVLTDNRHDRLAEEGDMNGMLYDWKAKGHELRLEPGIHTLRDWEMYKVRADRASGVTSYFYFDNKEFLLRMREELFIGGDDTIRPQTWFEDYREVEGVMLPHVVDQWNRGRSVRGFAIRAYELNKPLPDELFAPHVVQ